MKARMILVLFGVLLLMPTAAYSQGLVYALNAEPDSRTSGDTSQNPGASHQLDEVIWEITWSPDGTQIAVGKVTGVWIYTTNLELVTHLDVPFTDGLAWSPDGSKLAVGVNVPDTFYPNWAVQVWDMSSLTLEATGAQERAEWISLSWNPDGTHLAIANGRLYIWEVGAGQGLVPLEGNAPIVNTVTWSPDGNYLASTGSDRAVTIWNVADQTISLILENAGWTTPAVWSEDSTYIAVAYDVDATIWNVVTGQANITFPGEGLFVDSIDWRSDTLVTANPLATPSGASNVYVWNTDSGQLLNTIEEDANIFAVTLSPDGSRLIYGGVEGIPILADAQ